MKNWHEKVVALLAELCEEWKKTENYGKVFRGTLKNVITISYGKSVHFYQPDIYAYSKKGKVDIYEVLDSEDINAGIADLILSILTPNVRWICMACRYQKTADELKKVAKIIEGRLQDDDGKNLFKAPYYIEYIPVESDSNKLKKILRGKMRF